MSYFDVSTPLSAYKFNKGVLEELNKISFPLLKNLGIKLVTYRRFFNNGNLLHLSTDANWLEHCVKNHHWTSHSTIKRISLTPIGQPIINIWDQIPNCQDNVYQALHALGFTNGATIYERNANSVELWAFSGREGLHGANSMYANFQNILKKFTLYFQDKAKDILDVSDRSKLILGNSKLAQELSLIKNEGLDKLNKEIEISRYFLKGLKDDYILTRREAECLYYLCQGMTMKEIARVLDDINWRTVDSYVNHIKLKTNIDCTSTLIKTFYHTVHHWVF
jgi:DNA-binding CsgD family transcriptional regulator